MLRLFVLLSLLFCFAVAHETRTVGSFKFVVGFLSEPSFSTFLNSIDLRISDINSSLPVSGAEETLSVTVQYASVTPLAITLEQADDDDANRLGNYTGFFIPNKAGDYTFSITGSIGNPPQTINEQFTSAAGHFSAVRDSSAIVFPAVITPTSTTGDKSSASVLMPTVALFLIAVFYLF